MPTNLTGSTIASTFDQLLHVDDCAKLGEITREETKFVGLTCYVKRGERWIPASRAEYQQK